MKKNRLFGQGVRSDIDKYQLGYETENISPANYDQENFRFGTTLDGKFQGHNDQNRDVDDGYASANPH